MNRERPKLLFLAWSFPPIRAIGAVRTWNIAKSLTRLGWDVTVVTPDPQLIRNPDSPERIEAAIAREGIERIFTKHDWRFLSPDRFICKNGGIQWVIEGVCRRVARRFGVSRGVGWLKQAQRACSHIRREEVDLILASGPPFDGFVLAERLAKMLGRPYVLDYRDPWWTEVRGMFRVLQPMVDRLEARLVTRSAAVTVVSPSWAADLDSQFNVGPKLHVLTNGYDPEELADIEPHYFGHFAIVYTGIFYPPERVITPVLSALKLLDRKQVRGEWCFHYYGDDDRHVREEALRLGVGHRVKLHGMVSRLAALSAVKGANVAIVIASVSENASDGLAGWIPAKIFETVGLGVPVLLIAPFGSDVEKIGGPTGLIHRFSGRDIQGIASFLEKTILGSINIEKKDVESLSWTWIGQKLDRILREHTSARITPWTQA